MKLYPIYYNYDWDDEKKLSVICLCQTKADAEEMVLTLVEYEPYEQYLYLEAECSPTDFRQDPLKCRCKYFTGAAIPVLL